MMKDRPTGWRVEDDKWVFGPSKDPIVALSANGTIQVDRRDFGVWVRLKPDEAETLGRLLLAYAETGVVPMEEDANNG